MPNYNVYPTNKTPLHKGLYESLDPESILYSGNGINTDNQRDIILELSYPFDGQVKSFYVWPRF